MVDHRFWLWVILFSLAGHLSFLIERFAEFLEKIAKGSLVGVIFSYFHAFLTFYIFYDSSIVCVEKKIQRNEVKAELHVIIVIVACLTLFSQRYCVKYPISLLRQVLLDLNTYGS